MAVSRLKDELINNMEPIMEDKNMETIDLNAKDDRGIMKHQDGQHDSAFAEAERQWGEVATVEMLVGADRRRSSLLRKDYIAPEDVIAVDNESNAPSTRSSLSVRPSFMSTDRIRVLNIRELDDYVQNCNLEDYLPHIKPEANKSGLKSLLNFIFCLHPPKLASYALIEERNRLFALALRPFDNQDPYHFRFLSTIYQHLTETPLLECRRYGSHWDQIGFQGNDPATDLRGVGILGLINLVYFILTPETRQLAKSVYGISLDERQNFPFCLMGTNFTQITMQKLRSGQLNGSINQVQSVLQVFNQFYAGIYATFYEIWVREKHTVMDTGYVLNDLRSLVKNDQERILSAVTRFNQRLQIRLKNATSEQPHGKEDLQFSDIGNILDYTNN